MKYFTFFPKLNYPFSDANYLPVMNIFIRPEINLNDVPGINTKGNKYVIEDGESPDNIARKFYETPESFWQVLMTNNILDVYKEWPVSYDLWVKELVKTNGSYTFFTPYKMDIKVGDLVAKYISGDIFFDKNNFGMVTNVDSFLRSFDIQFVKGEIREQENYIIMRNTGSSYTIIKTPDENNYQSLKKRILKMDSAIGFKIQNSTDKQSVFISPYYNQETNEFISETIDSIENKNCILWNYMNNSLVDSISVQTFLKSKEEEWIFNKSLIILPTTFSGRMQDLYLGSLQNQ